MVEDLTTLLPYGRIPSSTILSSTRTPSPCERTVRLYLGLTADGILPNLHASWTPAATIGVGVIPPDTRQRAAGQRWGACVVYPQGMPGEAAHPSYTSTLHGAFSTGSPPSALAVCGNSVLILVGWTTSGSYEYAPCNYPHDAELLATGSTSDPALTQSDMDRDCGQIAKRLLARDDPTDGGQLSIAAASGFVDEREFYHPGFTHNPQSGSACVIAPADPRRHLVGPLLGLNGAPVPWA